MKKVIAIVLSIAAVGFIAFTLAANKEEMEENAKLAEVTSEAIPVEVTTAQQLTLDTKVAANGTFSAKNDLTILSETQGQVIKVYKEKGATVRKGELLAQVEHDLLEAEVEAAEANYMKLKTDLERFTKLSKEDAVTKRQLEEVRIGLKNAQAQFRSAKKRLDNTYIRATASGSINDDFVQEGAFISPGAKLYEIVDVSKLKLNVKLTANEILHVKEGDKITVTTRVYPSETFTATVTAIASKADAALKYPVEMELINKEGKALKPGMYATAHFNFKSEQEKLFLDRKAIVGSIQDPQVYVVANGKASLKNIVVGNTKEEKIEVIEGLSPQEKVVLSGQINLEEGIQVKVLK